MAKNYSWTWGSFYNGLSEDKYVGGKDQYQYGFNIDTQTSPRGVILSSAVVDSGWTFDAEITVMKDLAEWGSSGILVCTSNGKIYSNGTLKSTLTTADDKKIYNVTSLNVSGTDYLYFWTRSKIHRCPLSDLTTVTNDHLSYTSGGANFRPIINNFNLALFGNGNKVYSLDGDGEVLSSSPLITFKTGEVIRQITSFADQYKIYTNQGDTNGFQYFWNGSSSTASYMIPWPNLPFRAVVNNGPVDYCMTGSSQFYGDLYMSSGYDRKIVAIAKDGGGEKEFFPAMAMRVDILYLGGVGTDGTNGVFTYGNYLNGFPKSLNMNYKIAGLENINDAVKYILPTSGAYSYFAYTGESSTYKVAKIDHNLPPVNNYYSATGEIVSQVFTGGLIWQRKAIVEIDISYDLTSANGHGGTIQLYGRVDENASWTSIVTISDTTKKYEKVTANMLVDPLREFQQLELRAVLTAGTVSGNNTKTPFLNEITVTYEPINT